MWNIWYNKFHKNGCNGISAGYNYRCGVIMKDGMRTDSNLLIQMKDLTGLTIRSIAEGAGVPLGTAQKIFAGITKTPRQGAAAALYEYMLPYAEARKLQTAEQVSKEALSANNSQRVLRESETVYHAGKAPESRGRESVQDYTEGNLAWNIRSPGSYTIDDYRALPDDQRVELIDGFFYSLASPSTIHQRISGRLFHAFYSFIREQGGPCEVFAAPFDVQLDSDAKTMVQPDLVVICDPDRVKEWGLFGAPDLVIEILSPSTAGKDRTLKITKYEKAGVREYWIIDPEKCQTTVCLFHEDMPVSFYPFSAEIPVGIYNGKLKICLEE